MKKRRDETTAPDLDSLIEEVTRDAYGDDEQIWAFHCAFEDGIELPCDAFVNGERVSVIGFDYDGNHRRGLVAQCRRGDGSEYAVSASEVALAEQSKDGYLIAAYRKWLGLDPWPEQAAPPSRKEGRHKAAATDLDSAGPMDGQPGRAPPDRRGACRDGMERPRSRARRRMGGKENETGRDGGEWGQRR